jgi:hypothetical protein
MTKKYVVWKHRLHVNMKNTIKVPPGAKLLPFVREDVGFISVYVIQEAALSNQLEQTMTFRIVMTGEEFELDADYTHVGSGVHHGIVAHVLLEDSDVEH